MFVPPVEIIRRKRIVKRLLNAGAVTADTAVTLEAAGVFRGFGLIVSRLETHGVLIKLDNDRYYVDTKKYK